MTLLWFLLLFFQFQSIAWAQNETVCSEAPDIYLDESEVIMLTDGPGYLVISKTAVEDASSVASQCRVYADNDAVTFNLTSLLDCDPYITQDNDTLTVTYTIRSVPNVNTSFVIQRFTNFCLNVTCSFDINLLLNSSDGIYPQIRKLELDPVENVGEFDVSLAYQANEDFSTELNVSSVKVPDYLYVKATLRVDPGVEDDYVLQAEHCWASAEEGSMSPMYPIIQGGCKASKAWEDEDAIVVTENYESNFVKFRFQSFVWSGRSQDLQRIFVYCNLVICLPGEEDCSSPCDKRKRRDAPQITEGYRHKLASSGPINLKTPEKPNCEKNNGGCSEICEMHGDAIFCSCFEGKLLQENGKTCAVTESESEHIVVINLSSSQTFIITVTMVTLVLVVTGGILRFFYQKWRTSGKKLQC